VTKAEEFRRRAGVCDNLAEAAKDQETKRQLMEAARQWRAMAFQAEKYNW
jgi:hypothetical protein